MKKKVCVILGAGASAVTRHAAREDPRPRRAMRENGCDVLHPLIYPLTGLKLVGGLMRPGPERAMAQADLERLPGFGGDMADDDLLASRPLAVRGLKIRGVSGRLLA